VYECSLDLLPDAASPQFTATRPNSADGMAMQHENDIMSRRRARRRLLQAILRAAGDLCRYSGVSALTTNGDQS
jgi:hypothetical protein